MRPVYETIRRLTIESEVEICGGLYGYASGTELIITHSRACHNFDHSPTSFALDVEELLVLPGGLGETGGLAGIYHSHASAPALLSDTDHYFLSLARWMWLITGKSAGAGDFEMRCFGRIRHLVEEFDHAVKDEADT